MPARKRVGKKRVVRKQVGGNFLRALGNIGRRVVRGVVNTGKTLVRTGVNAGLRAGTTAGELALRANPKGAALLTLAGRGRHRGGKKMMHGAGLNTAVYH